MYSASASLPCTKIPKLKLEFQPCVGAIPLSFKRPGYRISLKIFLLLVFFSESPLNSTNVPLCSQCYVTGVSFSDTSHQKRVVGHWQSDRPKRAKCKTLGCLTEMLDPLIWPLNFCPWLQLIQTHASKATTQSFGCLAGQLYIWGQFVPREMNKPEINANWFLYRSF